MFPEFALIPGFIEMSFRLHIADKQGKSQDIFLVYARNWNVSLSLTSINCSIV